MWLCGYCPDKNKRYCSPTLAERNNCFKNRFPYQYEKFVKEGKIS